MSLCLKVMAYISPGIRFHKLRHDFCIDAKKIAIETESTY